jgi:hypothetical protein
MNPVLRKHLEEARRAHGVTFDVVRDWDALQDLARLADVVMQVDREGDALSIRPSCEIGGVLFHRMTIGAGEWLGRVMPWFEDSDRLAILAWAYAMAGARNPSADLWPFADSKARLVEQLKKFAAHIGATPLELSTALNAFQAEENRAPMPGDEPSEGEETAQKSGFGGLVDLLLAEYGGTPEQWLWHTPRAQIIDLCAKIGQRKRAEAGTGKADPNDPRVIAGHRLVMRLHDMVEAKKATA